MVASIGSALETSTGAVSKRSCSSGTASSVVTIESLTEFSSTAEATADSSVTPVERADSSVVSAIASLGEWAGISAASPKTDSANYFGRIIVCNIACGIVSYLCWGYGRITSRSFGRSDFSIIRLSVSWGLITQLNSSEVSTTSVGVSSGISIQLSAAPHTS